MTESGIFPWKSKETKEEGELGVVINFLAAKVNPQQSAQIANMFLDSHVFWICKGFVIGKVNKTILYRP